MVYREFELYGKISRTRNFNDKLRVNEGRIVTLVSHHAQ